MSLDHPANVSLAVRRRIIVLAMACVLTAGCDATVTPPASGPSGSPAADGSGGPGQTSALAATGGPIGTPGPGGLATETPLPVPTITDPGDIGAALYDPTKIPDAVMSLLRAMGAAVVAADGTTIQAAVDHGIPNLVLTESEARGWIEMTYADLESYEQTGGAITVSQLFEALAPSLPSAMTATTFADGYGRAYAESPEALAPLVMIGQPIAPETGLLRIQAWLLIVDGFLGRVGASGLRRLGGSGAQFEPPPGWAAAAAPRGRVGVASAYQPTLVSQIPGMTDAEWAELMSILPALAYRVPFHIISPSFGHEGHGTLGAKFDLTATYDSPDEVISPSSRRVILFPWTTPNPITVTWVSPDEGTLRGHGTIAGSLNTALQTDSAREVKLSYTLRKEPSNGRGELVNVVGRIDAVVDQLQLVRSVYQLNEAAVPALLLISGTRLVEDPLLIEWHEKDTIELTLSNPYDVRLRMTVGVSLVDLARIGTDDATGVLARQTDGTYTGAVEAETEGTYDGTSFVGECHDHSAGHQLLYVVGRLGPRLGAVDPSVQRLVSGQFGNRSLHLSFYPAAAPHSNSGGFPLCQPVIPFMGGGPDRRPPGEYLPFNDTRWSQPDTGYTIFLGQGTDALTYKDLSQYQVVTPGGGPLPGVDTGQTWWDVTVKVNGELPS